MKAVLISIRPKWCDKIVNGEKTVEVRKTRPKLVTLFKCYIYCTLKGSPEFFHDDLGGDVAKWNRGKWWDRKGKVIGEFVCRGFIPFCEARPCFVMEAPKEIERMACLTRQEIREYAPRGNPIGWRMTDLVIYDTPRELSEFTWPRTEENGFKLRALERPPQNWCYVEEMR